MCLVLLVGSGGCAWNQWTPPGNYYVPRDAGLQVGAAMGSVHKLTDKYCDRRMIRVSRCGDEHLEGAATVYGNRVGSARQGAKSF